MRGLIFLALTIVGCSSVTDVNKSIARLCNVDDALVQSQMAQWNSSKEDVHGTIGECSVLGSPGNLRVVYVGTN